jgi:uncharacterized RDD family membrane protein YckC
MDTEERVAPALPAGVVLAPFWRRAVGLGIDQFVALAPVFVVFLALGYEPKEMIEGTAGVWFNLGFVATGLLYETVGVWRFGRTVGKWVTRTRVVHVTDAGAVALSAAFIRSLVPAAFGVIPGIGLFLGMAVYLWAFVDPRRQGIHDKAAGTLVIL